MDARLIALKLFLDELGIPDDISKVENRIMIQKAVYLGQYAGADLGYRFIWHKRGPFCENLARDYYKLSESIATGDEEYKEQKLVAANQRSLRSIKPLMTPPARWSQDDKVAANWLELVASVHYLDNVTRLGRSDVKRVLGDEKPNLAEFIRVAESRIKKIKTLGPKVGSA